MINIIDIIITSSYQEHHLTRGVKARLGFKQKCAKVVPPYYLGIIGSNKKV